MEQSMTVQLFLISHCYKKIHFFHISAVDMIFGEIFDRLVNLQLLNTAYKLFTLSLTFTQLKSAIQLSSIHKLIDKMYIDNSMDMEKVSILSHFLNWITSIQYLSEMLYIHIEKCFFDKTFGLYSACFFFTQDI